MLWLDDLLLGGLEATTAAGFGLVALAEGAGMGTVRRGAQLRRTPMAQVPQTSMRLGRVGSSRCRGRMFVEVAAPVVIMLEQQFCRARNMHGAESTGWTGQEKGIGVS